MTLNTNVQATGLAQRKSCNVSLGRFEFGRDEICEREQTPSGTGESRWLGLAHKQRAV
jgi:hypothetical protein